MSTLSLRPMRLPAVLAIGALLAGLLAAGPALAHDPVLGVDPDSVEVTLAPGTSVDVAKTVHTPEILPTPDIYFLADSTGSMDEVIANVQADASSVLAAVDLLANDPRYGAGDYKDFQDPQIDPYAFLNGAAILEPDDRGEAVTDDTFLVMFNGHYEPIKFAVPDINAGQTWTVEIDTGQPTSEPATHLTGNTFPVAARSIQLLKRTS